MSANSTKVIQTPTMQFTAPEKESSVNPKASNYLTCQLYDTKDAILVLSGISLASCTPAVEQSLYSVKQPQSQELEPSVATESLKISNTMTCFLCSADFVIREEQKQHYKSDWHRFNLKQKMSGSKPIQEDEFDSICGNISSLSGSDTESEDSKSFEDTSSSDVTNSPRRRSRPSALPSHFRHRCSRSRSSSIASTDGEDTDDGGSQSRSRLQPKIYLKNKNGEIVALYRCVVHNKKNTPENEEHLIKMVQVVPDEMKWAVILVGGGHFAAGIFNGKDIVLHKTFHRYTVRSKQGGSQTSRDGKHGGHFPQSSGATLRRHNEAALKQDIQELLASWSSELQTCHRIFYRAPSFNKTILFGGKNPPFRKDDLRLHTIPFPTRRATFKEIQRVHKFLSTVECFGDNLPTDVIPTSPKVHLNVKKKRKSFRDKVTKTENQDLCNGVKSFEPEEKSWLDCPLSECKSEFDDTFIPSSEEFSFVDETITFGHLKEFEVTRKPRKGKSRSSSNPKRQQDPQAEEINKSPARYLVGGEEKYQMRNALYTSCKSGDVETLKKLLSTLYIETCFKNLDAKRKCLDTESGKEMKNPVDSITPLPMIFKKNVGELENILSSHQHSGIAHCMCDFKMEKDSASVKTELKPTVDIKTFTNHMPSFCCTAKKTHMRRHSIAVPPVSVLSNPKCSFDVGEVAQHSIKRVGSVPNSPRSRQQHKKHSCSIADIPAMTLDMLNEPISDSGATLLHVAAKEGHFEIIPLLLENNANPTIRDKQNRTPYVVCANKETRNEFRRFMAAHPEKFDYGQAEIPSPLTEEMEKERIAKQAEKKRARKQKIKERKVGEMQKKKDEEEKQRFLMLSDREKRALAADRRYVQQLASGSGPPVLSRCFQCAADITGKTPFEYSSNVFCSTQCVKKHRNKPKS